MQRSKGGQHATLLHVRSGIRAWWRPGRATPALGTYAYACVYPIDSTYDWGFSANRISVTIVDKPTAPAQIGPGNGNFLAPPEVADLTPTMT